MKFIKNNFIMVMLLLAAFLAACGGNAGSEPAASDDSESMEEMDHDDMENMDHDDDDDMEEMDHDHEAMDDEVNRIPNEGAVIHITSPASGDTFNAGDQVLVEVEVENFDLGSGENHWHVYIDGSSWGMVMGGNTDQPLAGLEPGEHEIAVYLSIDTHEEMEDGDSILITIDE